MKNNFELLCTKEIIEILQGDTKYGFLEIDGKKTDIEISMPYLSGPNICDLSNRFGFPAQYNYGSGMKSRWIYFEELLKHCVKNDNMSNLLAVIFSKEQFSKKFKVCNVEVIKKAYSKIVNEIISHINGILYLGSNELVCIGNNYYIKRISEQIRIDAIEIKTVDTHYIADISERAKKDIDEGNYDSAITKSRTLLEEVFCYVIEKKNEVPSEKGDIKRLYKQVKTLYNMHHKDEVDKRIRMLLSGLENVVTAIMEMRNKYSDAHGVGNKRIGIDNHHARLIVNSSMTMAEFILEVSDKNIKKYGV